MGGGRPQEVQAPWEQVLGAAGSYGGKRGENRQQGARGQATWAPLLPAAASPVSLLLLSLLLGYMWVGGGGYEVNDPPKIRF